LDWLENIFLLNSSVISTVRYLFLLLLPISLLLSSCGTTSRMGEPSSEPGTAGVSASKGEVIEEGIASWYGPNFHGKLTANGEKYDMDNLTAAHRTLPFNTIVKVKNLDNGKSVNVRINDRGPFAKNRIIDLSRQAAQKIDMLGPGTAHVRLVLMDGNLQNSRTTDLKVATYTVQLASFKTQDKAFDLSQKIQGARVEKINLENKTVFRVYFGLYVNKEAARKEQRQLKRQGYNGYVKQIQN